MRLDHAQDLAIFVEELKKETDRGLPLVGTALIDEKLHDTLNAFFIESKSTKNILTGSNAPLGTFSAKIGLCFSLGLIDECEYSEINLIRKIRNKFAHAKHGISFESDRIRSYCNSLESDSPQDSNYPVNEPRFRLTNAIVCIALRLYYRPDWVKKEKRVIKGWVTKDATVWRKIEDEKTPV